MLTDACGASGGVDCRGGGEVGAAVNCRCVCGGRGWASGAEFRRKSIAEIVEYHFDVEIGFPFFAGED